MTFFQFHRWKGEKMKTRVLAKPLIVIPFTILFIAACTLPAPMSTPLPTQLPAIPTNTLLPVVPTSTVFAPTTLPPTATTFPTLTAVPGSIRLDFAAGSTSGVAIGTIQPGQVINYLIGASKSQPLMVSTSSFNNDVTFSVLGLRDGLTLLSPSAKNASWQTMVTVSQDYMISVIAGATSENYTLNVIIPSRVKFAPGATSATVSGSTPNGFVVSYVIYALVNQQMDLTLLVPGGNAVLSVYGYEDGQPYMRSIVEQTTSV
jgi:hypothetical protein